MKLRDFTDTPRGLLKLLALMLAGAALLGAAMLCFRDWFEQKAAAARAGRTPAEPKAPEK